MPGTKSQTVSVLRSWNLWGTRGFSKSPYQWETNATNIVARRMCILLLCTPVHNNKMCTQHKYIVLNISRSYYSCGVASPRPNFSKRVFVFYQICSHRDKWHWYVHVHCTCSNVRTSLQYLYLNTAVASTSSGPNFSKTETSSPSFLPPLSPMLCTALRKMLRNIWEIVVQCIFC